MVVVVLQLDAQLTGDPGRMDGSREGEFVARSSHSRGLGVSNSYFSWALKTSVFNGKATTLSTLNIQTLLLCADPLSQRPRALCPCKA
jgi:hypothetical protein